MNILNCAEQAINEKGKIWINTKKENNHLIITISDSGEGIEKDAIKKSPIRFTPQKTPGKEPA
ncbi:hypothetical protein FH5T_06005 [Draconibacterium orientale]|uniref:Histidine kinase/HSP90-like ATPase domain-containing protein n=1 Tax=Draconibacterium orientale TaxID=1168034 RepID=A0ABN4D440_9BACT|nr:hypothetical protein FH5T_06005 [Draconibacterium orientale]